MHIGDLAKRVVRSVDTLRRWENDGLLVCERDNRGQRVYNESHVEVCLRLADLGLLAQRRSEKLVTLASSEPTQLYLLAHDDDRRLAS